MYRDVLSVLVEAVRNRPDEQRFELVRTDQGGLVSHSGLPNGELRVRLKDIEILARKGFITPVSSSTVQEFQLIQTR